MSMRSSIESAAAGEGLHRWSVRTGADTPEESFAAFGTRLRQFAGLGQRGAFASSDSDGTDCSMRVVRENHPEPGLLEVLVDVRRCDLRYARPLRNMAYGMGEAAESPVLEFRVELADRGQQVIRLSADVDHAEVAAGRFYPELSPRLGVRVQKARPVSHRANRRAWLTCVQTLSVELVTDLIELTDQWGSMLYAGYPMSEADLQDGTSVILNVSGSQHDEVTFEVLLDRFIASDAAFVSLLSLLVIRARRETDVTSAVVE
jgi:hypothetical protein